MKISLIVHAGLAFVAVAAVVILALKGVVTGETAMVVVVAAGGIGSSAAAATAGADQAAGAQSAAVTQSAQAVQTAAEATRIAASAVHATSLNLPAADTLPTPAGPGAQTETHVTPPGTPPTGGPGVV